MDTMKKLISRLAGLFSEMSANANTFGSMWKNIELGKEAFAIMKELPETVPGEFDTPAEKAALLGSMLEQMNETDTPRFCIGVREYMRSLSPDDEDNARELAMLRDYIDLSLPMEEYCRRYRRHLKFDPVERTEEMERVVADVERECDRRLAGTPRGMGFCFAYWSARGAALSRRGIDWRSPSLMNPGVMFD